MADPLSICASIAGLVNLADLVFSRAYKYVKSVKNASKDVKTLSSEIGALYGILCNLRLVSDQLEDENVASTMRAEHIYSCYQTLERVKSVLEKHETRSLYSDQRTALKRNLRWPFTSQEVKVLVDEIERHKATLGLALNVDGMLGLLQALSKQNDINQSLKDINTELKLEREAETRVAIDRRRQKVLDSFGYLDPRKNLDMARKLRHPGTGFWLTESPDFKLWLDTDHAHLWLYGIPGSGKTIPSSLLVEEILSKSNPDIAIAYFFCDYKTPATQQPCQIPGCLVQQLAKQDEQSFAKVQNFYDNCGSSRRVPGEYEPEDLCHLTVSIAENYDCTMIIIDGLDECGESARYVTELLGNLSIERSNVNIKTLLLSRDELDIRQCLEHYPRMSIAAKNGDLKLYVDAEIEQRTRKKMLNIKSPELKEHIRERLVQGAEGMYACCQQHML